MPTISFDVPAIKTSAFETIDGGEKWGTLTAIDLKAKGKIPSQQKTEDPLIGGVLATAGGLVFTDEAKGDLSAFRCKTGKVCGASTAAGVNAPPVSYAVDGKPYVALAAAGTLWAWEWRTSGVPCAIGRASLPVIIAGKKPGTCRNMSVANKCACRRTFRLETITARLNRDSLEHEK